MTSYIFPNKSNKLIMYTYRTTPYLLYNFNFLLWHKSKVIFDNTESYLELIISDYFVSNAFDNTRYSV